MAETCPFDFEGAQSGKPDSCRKGIFERPAYRTARCAQTASRPLRRDAQRPRREITRGAGGSRFGKKPGEFRALEFAEDFPRAQGRKHSAACIFGIYVLAWLAGDRRRLRKVTAQNERARRQEEQKDGTRCFQLPAASTRFEKVLVRYAAPRPGAADGKRPSQPHRSIPQPWSSTTPASPASALKARRCPCVACRHVGSRLDARPRGPSLNARLSPARATRLRRASETMDRERGCRFLRELRPRTRASDGTDLSRARTLMSGKRYPPTGKDRQTNHRVRASPPWPRLTPCSPSAVDASKTRTIASAISGKTTRSPAPGSAPQTMRLNIADAFHKAFDGAAQAAPRSTGGYSPTSATRRCP